MNELIFVYMTFENQDQAESIGETLVSEQLVACVNIFPAMRTIYKWQGQIQSGGEVVGIAKTRKSNFKTLTARVKELHTYETPCIVSLELTDGNSDFMKWITASTS